MKRYVELQRAIHRDTSDSGLGAVMGSGLSGFGGLVLWGSKV